MTNNDNLLDLTIFEQGPALMNDCVESYDTCKIIKRILTGLSYYNRLDTTNNINDRLIFINFMDTTFSTK